jgi:predicted DNA-binding protein with PD1-like motif
MTKHGAYYALGKCGRFVPVRLKTHTDINDGLRAVCKESGIKYGAVYGIGNVRQFTHQLLVPDSKAKHGVRLDEPQVIPGPLELNSLKGVIYQSERGETIVHLHGIFSDTEGKLVGGHLAESGNPVLGTVDAFIVELADAKLVSQMDEDVGLSLSTPIGAFANVKSPEQG